MQLPPEHYLLGIDLAGPAAPERTGVALFTSKDGGTRRIPAGCDGSDEGLRDRVAELATETPVIVGIDAPLSYQPGGGQREADAELRRVIQGCGMHPGSIIPPTAPRMVYVTLRGVALAHALTTIDAAHPVRVVEVHPGATFCLRGAPLAAIRGFATDPAARGELLHWLGEHSVDGLDPTATNSDHDVAACAAALGARDWFAGRSQWLYPAQPPWHPFDFAC
jgi:predicted nuclease with RNAse H fold